MAYDNVEVKERLRIRKFYMELFLGLDVSWGMFEKVFNVS
jgi:hypothetical protein